MKPDRKTVERNRRIRMKLLCSQLYALLPNPQTITMCKKASPPLPDRLDETVNYILGLQENIKRMEEKKRQLLQGSSSISISAGPSSRSMSWLPHIHVQDLAGMGLQVIITSSPCDFFVFNEAIRIIEDQGVEIANANFFVSAAGDRAFHIIHVIAGENMKGYEASKLLERLNRDIHLLF